MAGGARLARWARVNRKLVIVGAPIATTLAVGIGISLRTDGEPSCADALEPAERHLELTPEERRLGLDQCEGQRWSKEMRACLVAATDRPAVDRCGDMRPPRDELGHAQGFLTGYRQDQHRLNELKAALLERPAFPTGRQGPTPTSLEACCADTRRWCRSHGPEWREGIWGELGVQLHGPGYFAYEYESSDGTTAILRAIADFDCDGTWTVLEYHCAARTRLVSASCEWRAPDVVD